jgi:toxin ParE1/3/4
VVANRFVAAIEATFEPVRHFPLSAPLREHMAPGLRVTFHSPYAVYYRPTEDAITIIRVLHGARDIAAIVERGGFEQ